MTGSGSILSVRNNEILHLSLPYPKNIWRVDGLQWTPVPNDNKFDMDEVTGIAASHDGWHWVITKTNKIYRWNVCEKAWEAIPGALNQIDAFSRDAAIGVYGGEVKLWQKHNWTTLSIGNIKPKSAAIGDEKEIWIVDEKDQLFRHNQSSKVFDHIHTCLGMARLCPQFQAGYCYQSMGTRMALGWRRGLELDRTKRKNGLHF